MATDTLRGPVRSRVAPPAPRVGLSGWGNATRSFAELVPVPTPDAVAGLLAGQGRRGVLPRGLGRSYGDVAQNGGGRVLDLTDLGGITAFDPTTGVVTAQAGLSLDRLLARSIPAGWFLPWTPGTRFVTLGGAVANDVHGKNHHRDGSFRQAVRRFELVTPEGSAVTVEPGEPLFDATLGGLGLTGVVVEVTLQLLRIQTSWMRVHTERALDLDELFDRLRSADQAARYSVAWVDCLARGRRLGRSVLLRGDHAVLDELPLRLRGGPLRAPRGQRARVPSGTPRLLGRPGAAAFNAVWFARAAAVAGERLQPLEGFFYPLDAVADWPRLYGPRGFVQYQFVVPHGAEPTVAGVIEQLAAARCPSFLAVLKQFGPGGGLLSFPTAGWTLAVDLPSGVPGLGPLLDRFDERVAAAGGRVYLAKDARMRPEAFRAMYPELARWQAVRDQADPRGVLRSDLGRRLGLCG